MLNSYIDNINRKYNIDMICNIVIECAEKYVENLALLTWGEENMPECLCEDNKKLLGEK